MASDLGRNHVPAGERRARRLAARAKSLASAARVRPIAAPAASNIPLPAAEGRVTPYARVANMATEPAQRAEYYRQLRLQNER